MSLFLVLSNGCDESGDAMHFGFFRYFDFLAVISNPSRGCLREKE